MHYNALFSVKNPESALFCTFSGNSRNIEFGASADKPSGFQGQETKFPQTNHFSTNE
jgi:hypothetical protein